MSGLAGLSVLNVVAANNGPDPGAVLNSMKQYVKAQTSNCYNGFHQTMGGKAVQSFSALALFPVASNAGDNRLALGAEVLGGWPTFRAFRNVGFHGPLLGFFPDHMQNKKGSLIPSGVFRKLRPSS